MALEKTIYIGPFVHCESLNELDVCPNGMVGVDEDGKIAFVLRSMKGRRFPDDEGWEEAKIVRILDHGFFFPGFIGMPCVNIARPVETKRDYRYAYTCLTVSQCWRLRQVYSSGLVEHVYISNGVIFHRSRESSTSLQSSRCQNTIPRNDNGLLLRDNPRARHESPSRHLPIERPTSICRTGMYGPLRS